MQKLKKLLKKGDTIIEVTFAISVFSLISLLSMQVMDRDVSTIQGALETEMARNEIDAQAEALRFIQNSFLSERELQASAQTYKELWYKLSRGPSYSVSTAAGSGLTNKPTEISSYTANTCTAYYNSSDSSNYIVNDRAFVINTRNINPSSVENTIIQSNKATTADKFREAPIYPRIIFSGGSGGGSSDSTNLSELFPEGSGNATYQNQWKYHMSGSSAVLDSTSKVYNKVAYAEGIWVISARDMTKGESATPEFFDFHIRTCWFSPGHDRPSTIATTIRLYNPEYVEGHRVE